MPRSFQATSGSLSFIKLVCTGATFNTGDDRVVGSDLEVALRTIATRATVVIAQVPSGATTELHVALENAGYWDLEGNQTFTALEAAIVAASAAVSGNISGVVATAGVFTVA